MDYNYEALLYLWPLFFIHSGNFSATTILDQAAWRPPDQRFEIHQRLLAEFRDRGWRGLCLIECGGYTQDWFQGVLPEDVDWRHRWLADQYAIIEAKFS